MNKNIIIAALCVSMVLGMSGIAAASKDKLEIISPIGGEKIEYGEPIEVQYVNPYSKVVEYVEILGDNGQAGSRMKIITRANRNTQTVFFDTGNNLLSPGNYHVRLAVYKKGKMLEEKIGGTFKITSNNIFFAIN